jgi:hypothetical protein
MNNKILLTALTLLAYTYVQATFEYPGLTNNYDSVLKANIADLRISNSGITKKQLKNMWPHYLVPLREPINLSNIKIPVHIKFVDAGHYFSDELIYGKYLNKPYELDVYILKDQLTRILAQKHMSCEYQINLESYYGDKHFDNLDDIKDEYFNYAADTGFDARSFIDQDDMQGYYFKEKNGFKGGLVHVLVKNRALSLSISDCTKTISEAQIIKDLTEWGELLIESNH